MNSILIYISVFLYYNMVFLFAGFLFFLVIKFLWNGFESIAKEELQKNLTLNNKKDIGIGKTKAKAIKKRERNFLIMVLKTSIVLSLFGTIASYVIK